MEAAKLGRCEDMKVGAEALMRQLIYFIGLT
jgi:hypothetical protein